MNTLSAESSIHTESSVHINYRRSSGRIISILQVQLSETEYPIIDGSITEKIRLSEWRKNMTHSWRERIEVIFSNQNQEFQPLPSWSEVSTQPDNPWDKERWGRDNNMRRFLSAILNGGYIRTDIVISDSPPIYDSLHVHENTITYDHNDYTNENWFNEGHQGLAEEYAPRNSRVDIFKDDYTGLEKLWTLLVQF